jgi:hypothetical protein
VVDENREAAPLGGGVPPVPDEAHGEGCHWATAGTRRRAGGGDVTEERDGNWEDERPARAATTVAHGGENLRGLPIAAGNAR